MELSDRVNWGWHTVNVALTALVFLRKHQVLCLALMGSGWLLESARIQGTH